MHDRVEQELQNLQTAGIIEPISFSERAAPVVTILKCDEQSIFLCGELPSIIQLVTKLSSLISFRSLKLWTSWLNLLVKSILVLQTKPGIPTVAFRW